MKAVLDNTVLYVLPGVPAEMEAIFEETIAPEIAKSVGESVFCQRSLFVEGIFESKLAPLIDAVMKDNKGVYIKSHPLSGHIELHLTIRARLEEKPAEMLLKAAMEIAQLIEQNSGKIQTPP
jgi:molybdopterin-biosynthesis enzyme MoeA-like protein